MVTKTSGKRDNQKLKTYLILQYFLQYSDERHPLRMQDILLHLQNGAFGPSDWIRTEQPAGGGLLAAAGFNGAPRLTAAGSNPTAANAKIRAVPKGTSRILVRVTGFEPAAS